MKKTRNMLSKEEVERLNKQQENKLRVKKEKLKKISSTPAYILWAERFTSKYPRFSNDEYDSFEGISKRDIQNIKDLPLLYQVVDEYAQQNFITPQEEKGTTFPKAFYLIVYNDKMYKLAIMSGQGVAFTLERVSGSKARSHFLNFKDVLSNRKQFLVETYNGMLNKFSNQVEDMLNMGIPDWAIRARFEQAINH